MMRIGCAALLVLACCTDEQELATPGRTVILPPAREPYRLPELRIGVGAMLSPMSTFKSYDALLSGIARAHGRPYQMVQRRTYQELNQLIIDGELDLAFISSGAWVSLPPGAADILVVPERKGSGAYHGLIVTQRGAPYRSFADLEQTRFAFTDPLSITGHFYPLSLIAALGKEPSTFFSSTIFSGSHDRSLLAVQRGIIDAAAVSDVGFELIEGARSELRVLERSPAMAPPPVVVPPGIPAELRASLRDYLLHVADQPDNRAKLDAIGVERFRLPTSVDYSPLRRMMEEEAATGNTQ